MTLVLKINDVDKSSSIDWTTLSKSEGLTKEPDILSFSIKETVSKAVPSLGDEIKLELDSVLVFAGVVTESLEDNIGGLLIQHNINCKDFSHLFDRELVVKSYEDQTVRQIILDIVSTFTTGFTTNNVPTSTPTVSSIKFNYEAPTKAIQKLVDLVGLDWYIDYEKDLHVVDDFAEPAPFEVNDTNDKIDLASIQVNRNILDLRNSIFVRGGEFKTTIIEANAIDKKEADGTQRIFNLALKYSGINVKVDTTAQTVGIDNITDPLTVDVLYNFQERVLKWRENNKPTAGQTVTIWGDAFIPLIAKVRDQTSIATYGEYQDIKIDKSITSVSEAQTLAKAILRKWQDGAHELSFTTDTPGLRTGQQILINSISRGINKSFKITRTESRANSNGTLKNTIFCLSSGETTFVDIMVGLLGKDKINLTITNDEVLQRLETINEIITTVELVVPVKKTPPYTWGIGGTNDFEWNFFTWA